jgi:hypothetical protein
MKSARRVLFVLFYIAATIAVAEDRSVHAVDRFNASRSSETRLKVPCHHLINALPHFSHSKRPRPYVPSASAAVVQITKPVPGEFEERPRIEYRSPLGYEVSSTRGPPVLI